MKSVDGAKTIDFFDAPIEFGAGVKGELANSKQCLDALQKIRADVSKFVGGRSEFFDLDIRLGLELEKTTEAKLAKLTQACVWQSLALKSEFSLKLLHSIDGYLSAVETKNPISMYLLTRYLLELVATVNAIDVGLEEINRIDVRDWKKRGTEFLALLYRARHSSSDEKIKLIFSQCGIPIPLIQPIKIKKAMAQLIHRDGFKAAVSIYGFLSNVCHHNGSGHAMFTESFRTTNSITARSGGAFFLPEKVLAVTMEYPAINSAAFALARTARVAWFSAHSAAKITMDMLESPFTEKEFRKLTNRRMRIDIGYVPANSVTALNLSSQVKRKVGRNEPCPCGSGKKYKACCSQKALANLGETKSVRNIR